MPAVRANSRWDILKYIELPFPIEGKDDQLLFLFQRSITELAWIISVGHRYSLSPFINDVNCDDNQQSSVSLKPANHVHFCIAHIATYHVARSTRVVAKNRAEHASQQNCENVIRRQPVGGCFLQ